jgi:hypothetical protein
MAETPDAARADETLGPQLAVGRLAVPILKQVRFSTTPAYEALKRLRKPADAEGVQMSRLADRY